MSTANDTLDATNAPQSPRNEPNQHPALCVPASSPLITRGEQEQEQFQHEEDDNDSHTENSIEDIEEQISEGRDVSQARHSQGGSITDGDDATTSVSTKDTEVVYVRDGVSICPTANNRIDGRLSLVRQHRVLFIAWLPYAPAAPVLVGAQKAAATAPTATATVEKSQEEDNVYPPSSLARSETDGASRNTILQSKADIDRSLYAIHPIPLSDIRAVRPHTPRLRQHTATLILHSGITMPPFHFRQGGVKSFLSCLKQHVNLLPSADTPGAYLVNDLADPLQRSLTTLELADALPSPPPGMGATSWPLARWQLEQEARDGSDSDGEGGPSASLIKGLMLKDLVDRFQKLKQGAQDAASSFLSGSVMLGNVSLSEHLAHIGQATVAAGGGDVEGSYNNVYDTPFDRYNGLSHGNTQTPRHAPRDVAVPEALHTSLGQENDEEDNPTGHQTSLQTSPSSASVGWELIDPSVSSEMATSPTWTRPRPPPLTVEELAAMMDAEGRLIDPGGLRSRAFYGGIDPGARPQVWKWLLGVDSVESTREERKKAEAGRKVKYLELRKQWQSMGSEQASRFGKWRERKSRVDKDVRRTDRKHPFYSQEGCSAATMLRNVLLTHVMWNFDLGYCQGMSDLAAPLLWIARTALPSERKLSADERNGVEAEAFWMFARLMDGMDGNFSSDCVGMHAQLDALRRLLLVLDPPLHAHLARHDALNLFFCYRWVLILFKREFSFDQVLRLWEALWARTSDHLHLYLCVALLARQRRRILDEDMDFDDLLKLCVDLAGNIDLEQSLADAEMLRDFAGAAGEMAVLGGSGN